MIGVNLVLNSVSLLGVADQIFDRAEKGFDHSLAMRVLKHGTNYKSFIEISKYGLDPNQSQSLYGHTMKVCDNYVDYKKSSLSRFFPRFFREEQPRWSYLAKDWLYRCREIHGPKPRCSLSELLNYELILPPVFQDDKTYVHLSTQRLFHAKDLKAGEPLSSESSSWKCWIVALGTPVLKFKITEDDIKKQFNNGNFEQNPLDLEKRSLRTCKKIEPSRIGISGSIRYGANKDVWKRLQSNPLSIVAGVINFFIAYKLLCFCPKLFTTRVNAFSLIRIR